MDSDQAWPNSAIVQDSLLIVAEHCAMAVRTTAFKWN